MEQILKILEKAPSLKIAVIGDFIEDRYVIGDVDRISPEAPVPVVRVTSKVATPGGAGNVFMNLIGLGVEAHLFSDIGHTQRDLFSQNQEPMIHQGRWNHSIKTRIMSGNHHIVRYDEDTVPIYMDYAGVKWRDTFELNLQEWDAVILSDYHKGVISDDIAERVITMCGKYMIPVIVDAKKDFPKYVNANILKCNGKEWAASPYRQSQEFVRKMDLDALVITHGALGMEMQGQENWNHFNGHTVPIADTCGAGDTVTAMLAIGEALCMERWGMASLANRCAAEVCKHPGVYALTIEDLIKIKHESTAYQGTSVLPKGLTTGSVHQNPE